jgi:hypothetical protein
MLIKIASFCFLNIGLNKDIIQDFIDENYYNSIDIKDYIYQPYSDFNIVIELPIDKQGIGFSTFYQLVPKQKLDYPMRNRQKKDNLSSK